ncbi:MAG: tetratricopeptide repeat protein [Calditrichia bacterium]
MENSGYLPEIIIILSLIAALIIIFYFARRYRRQDRDKNKYQTALEMVVDRDYKNAIQMFKEVVREDSENVEAYLRLGDLLRERGLPKNALRIHKDLTLRSGLTKPLQARIQHSMMLDYEMLQDYQQAARIARTMLEENQHSANLYIEKLLFYSEKNQEWESAEIIAKKYTKELPERYGRRLALYRVLHGLELQEKDQGRDARVKFKEAIKADSQCAAAYYYLGKSYYVEDRAQEAVDQWRTLCTKVPDQCYIVYADLEKTWFEMGKFTEAEKLYTGLLEKNPDNIPAALALASIYSKKGNFEQAQEILERIEKLHPGDERILARHTHVLFEKSEFKSAGNKALKYFQDKGLLENQYYTCSKCGYKNDYPIWICPECQTIESYNI